MGWLQDWHCAICRVSMNELEHGLMVDHDHDTGQVRGLLCRYCNLMLGNAFDNVSRLNRGGEYLQLWKAEHDTSS